MKVSCNNAQQRSWQKQTHLTALMHWNRGVQLWACIEITGSEHFAVTDPIVEVKKSSVHQH